MNWDRVAALMAVGFAIYWIVATVRLWPAARWRALGRIAKAFSRAIDLRAPGYAGESERTAELVARGARRQGLGLVERERTLFAARLSNIGLAAVPHRVLNAPGDARIRELIAGRHPEIGAAMVELIPVIGDVAPLIRAHHVDASGDPAQAVVSASSAFAIRERAAGSDAARDLMVARAAQGDSGAVALLSTTRRG